MAVFAARPAELAVADSPSSSPEVIEAGLLSSLDHANFLKRSEGIETLRAMLKENDGALPVKNLKRLFGLLKARLDDPSWNVAHQCTQLLAEIISSQGDADYLPQLLAAVLPQLVDNLGDSKLLIRKESLSTLAVLARSRHLRAVVAALVRHGLLNSDVRRGLQAREVFTRAPWTEHVARAGLLLLFFFSFCLPRPHGNQFTRSVASSSRFTSAKRRPTAFPHSFWATLQKSTICSLSKL